MTITDGDKTMTLEELAEKFCKHYECCEDDGCPAAGLCGYKHNGMVALLRKVVEE